MKHLKHFEAKQEIKKKDLQETIDEVLDSLSKKGELSDSEKEFMTAASNDEVKNVTTPKMSGDFWSDMSNPHNTGIMWEDKEGVWKLLTEYEEPTPEGETEDEKFEREKNAKIKKYLDETPGLREDLQNLLDLEIEVNNTAYELEKKYKRNNDNDNYNFNTKLDYATNGTIDSLINQFGFYDEDDENEYGDPTPKIL